jgi:hypothetical protein
MTPNENKCGTRFADNTNQEEESLRLPARLVNAKTMILF